ncbi:cell division protein FtsL [Pseudorhizobium sp. NPDC055634]
MLRSFDLVLIGVMTAAAVVTYTIKHQADDKLKEVRRLEREIVLEKDTIDLLRADWALLTQPNRLERLIAAYQSELQLVPTRPTQLAMPVELPMPRSQLPMPETTIEELIAGAGGEVAAAIKGVDAARNAAPANGIPVPIPRGGVRLDAMATGSVGQR